MTSSEGFLLQQVWGTIQVSETALRQIWLSGYAAGQALEAYLAVIMILAAGGRDFDAELLSVVPGQAQEDERFDALFGKIVEFQNAVSIDESNGLSEFLSRLKVR
ncbi:MAG: hypothetical protein J2P54_05530 [Bradyrhizobiaceae bacterium]|nr:hypothetical protein [Bradyrhizobiaceae bacterium]